MTTDPESLDINILTTTTSNRSDKVIFDVNLENNAGTPVVLCFGFMHEEVAQVRTLLDSVGAHEMRVVSCSDAMLQLPIAFLLALPETDWQNPRLIENQSNKSHKKAKSNTSKSNVRCLILANISLEAQLTVQGLLEHSGIPPLYLFSVQKSENNKHLGEIIERMLLNHPQPFHADLSYKLTSETILDQTSLQNPDIDLKRYMLNKTRSEVNKLKKINKKKIDTNPTKKSTNVYVNARILKMSEHLLADQIEQSFDYSEKYYRFEDFHHHRAQNFSFTTEKVMEELLRVDKPFLAQTTGSLDDLNFNIKNTNNSYNYVTKNTYIQSKKDILKKHINLIDEIASKKIYRDQIIKLKNDPIINRRKLVLKQINYSGKIFNLKNFTLLIKPKRQSIPIYLAAINQRMVNLAWELGDGVIFYLRPLDEMKKIISKMQSEKKLMWLAK
jgi:hypothetical protein